MYRKKFTGSPIKKKTTKIYINVSLSLFVSPYTRHLSLTETFDVESSHIILSSTIIYITLQLFYFCFLFLSSLCISLSVNIVEGTVKGEGALFWVPITLIDRWIKESCLISTLIVCSVINTYTCCFLSQETKYQLVQWNELEQTSYALSSQSGQNESE